MKVYVVNSNVNPSNKCPNCFQYMLRQNRVITYYDRANQVNGIQAGDLVLLYHNDNRVIAVGFAVKDHEEHNYSHIASHEHWVDVNWLWKTVLNKNYNPVNPIDRNSVGFNIPRRTVEDVTKQINLSNLLEEMGKRQRYLSDCEIFSDNET